MKRVIKSVHVIPMGMANAFLIEGDDGLTLIDAGYPNKEVAVFDAIRGLGHSPDQLKHLIFTHGHPDHIGSAAAIVRETRCENLHAPARYPSGRERRSFSASESVTWALAASAMQTVLPSRLASGPGFHRPAFGPWRNAVHHWRLRCYSYTWALCGTGRATVASRTHAIRGRCLH